MITRRRVALVATLLAATSLLVTSCGDDSAAPPPPPPAGPVFAWQNPTPTGDAMRGVWGSSANNVTAVGDAGTLLRYDGSTWRVMDIRLGDDVLWDIWGAGVNDIWVVGDRGKIWHFDGARWTEIDSKTTTRLRAVSGFNPNNVYAVGDQGTVVRWNGTVWATVPQTATTANLLDVLALSPTSIWAVTDDPVKPLLRFNGNTWVSVIMPSMNAHAIWGTASDDLFVVGSVGTIAHKEATGWEFTSPGGTETLFGIYGFSASPATSAFAVGTNSTILVYDGNDWNPASVSGSFPLYAVWGNDENSVHALGASGGVYDYSGVGWSQGSSSVSTTTLCGMTAFGSSRYACGSDGTILSNPGSGWAKMTSNTAEDLNSIFAIAADDVFAVGENGEIVYYNGTNWSVMTSGVTENLTGVWGADTLAVAVGSDSVIAFDGVSWSAMPTTADASGLLAVWGSAVDNIVGVGHNGMIMRYNGTQWAPEISPVGTALRAVSGTAADDIYAAGDNGRVLYYDGSGGWTDIMGGRFQVDLYGVATSSVHGVWAVGDLGAICVLTESGTASFSAAAALAQEWVEVSFTNQSQRSAAVDGSGSVFLGGAGGTIIRYGQ